MGPQSPSKAQGPDLRRGHAEHPPSHSPVTPQTVNPVTDQCQARAEGPLALLCRVQHPRGISCCQKQDTAVWGTGTGRGTSSTQGVQLHSPQLSQPPALSAAPSQVLPVGQELNTPPIPSGCSPLQSCLSFPIPLQHPHCTPESQGRFPVSGPSCWLLPPCSLPAQAPAGLAACLCREDLMLPVPARPYPRAPLVSGCTQSRPWHHWGRGLAAPWGPQRPLVVAAE